LHAREKLTLSEKELSGVIFERGVDGKGFAQIRSKGDAALFGGYTTNEMKGKLGIPASRPLADFLPGVTIKAKDLANEITNFNIKKDRAIQGEHSITREHAKNNKDVRELLAKSGIRPESLPAEEDIKKVGRRVASEGKKLSKTAKKMKK